MTNLTISGAKALARGMIDRMSTLGVSMSLSQALEAVAASHHYQDWNRFRSALKQSREASQGASALPSPPHRLLVAFPGNGAGPTLQFDFAYQAKHPDMFPIKVHMIGRVSRGYFAEVIVPELGVAVIDAKYDPIHKHGLVFSGTVPPDCQGLIINLWNAFPVDPQEKLLSDQQNRMGWHALARELPGMLSARQLEMAGTLYIDDFHQIDDEDSIEYDVTLPGLMRELRVSNPTRLLVVKTQSDVARKSFYNSPDAWRLITMIGDDQKLFYRCPHERLPVYQSSFAPERYYARLFKDPSRYLEDAALFIGNLNPSHIRNAKLPADPYGAFLVTSLRNAQAWTLVKAQEEKAAIALSALPAKPKPDHRSVL